MGILTSMKLLVYTDKREVHNLSKRIFATILTAVMLLGLAPCSSYHAASVAVDLIHNSDNSIRDGVKVGYYVVDANGNEIPNALGGNINNIIDGNETSQGLGETTYTDTSPGGYYQIDLGGIKTITGIKYSMMNSGFADNKWRCMNYEILLSNDPDFAEFETASF